MRLHSFKTVAKINKLARCHWFDNLKNAVKNWTYYSEFYLNFGRKVGKHANFQCTILNLKNL